MPSIISKLNFEDIRKSSSNGKKPFNVFIGSSVVKVATRRDRRTATISFDLFPGDRDLTEGATSQLRSQYRNYLDSVTGRRQSILEFPSHFTKTSIWFQVLAEDAGSWFNSVYSMLCDTTNAKKIDGPT